MGVTRLACTVAVASITLAGSALSLAQDGFCLPTGVACTGFPLQIDVFAPDHGQTVVRQFKDKAGNVVRLLTVAGQGNTLVFTRAVTEDCSVTSQKQLSIKTNGSVVNTRYNADGTQTVTNTGQNVVIFFPTDHPGPSSNLYVGRLIYTIDILGAFTLKSFNGAATDICAALQ